MKKTLVKKREGDVTPIADSQNLLRPGRDIVSITETERSDTRNAEVVTSGISGKEINDDEDDSVSQNWHQK